MQDTTGFQPDPLLRQQKLDDIQTCYEIKFSHISDRYFKSQPWPHPDQVALLSQLPQTTRMCVTALRVASTLATLVVTWCVLFGTERATPSAPRRCTRWWRTTCF